MEKEAQILSRELGRYVSENKRQLIEQALQFRTRYLAVLLEDIQDPFNANAVIRTLECLGVQEYHVVENHTTFDLCKGVSKGAAKWVDVVEYKKEPTVNNTRKAIEGLRARGYKIYATSPHVDGKSPETLDLSSPAVIMLGNESNGLSTEAMKLADGFLTLPMYGFTESYNISVSAALCFYTLIHRMRMEVPDWKLSEKEINALRLDWYKKTLKKIDKYQKGILKRYRDENHL